MKPTYSYLIEEVVFRDKEGKFSFTGPACVIRFTGRWRVVNKELYVEVKYYDYDYELRTIFVNSCQIIETEEWPIMECHKSGGVKMIHLIDKRCVALASGMIVSMRESGLNFNLTSEQEICLIRLIQILLDTIREQGLEETLDVALEKLQ